MGRRKTGRTSLQHKEFRAEQRIWLKGDILRSFEQLALKNGFVYANGVWKGQGDVNSFIQALGKFTFMFFSFS